MTFQINISLGLLDEKNNYDLDHIVFRRLLYEHDSKKDTYKIISIFNSKKKNLPPYAKYGW